MNNKQYFIRSFLYQLWTFFSKNFVPIVLLVYSTTSLSYIFLELLYFFGVQQSFLDKLEGFEGLYVNTFGPEHVAINLDYISFLAYLVYNACIVFLALALLKRRKDAWYITLIVLTLSIFFGLSRYEIISINSLQSTLFPVLFIFLLLINKRYYNVCVTRLFEKKVYIKNIQKIIKVFIVYLIGLYLITHNIKRATHTAFSNIYFSSEQNHFRFIEYYKVIFFSIIAILVIKIVKELVYSFNYEFKNFDTKKIIPLLQKYGSDTLDYFITNYKKQHFLKDNGVLGFQRYLNLAVVSGDPVVSKESFTDFVNEFEKTAMDEGRNLSFISISKNASENLKKMGYKTLKIGEEAIVGLQNFELKKMGEKAKNIRRSLRLMDKEKISFKLFNMNDLPAQIYSQMKAIDKEWIKSYGALKHEEKGFSMTASRLPEYTDKDALFAVALKFDQEDGLDKIVGFLTLMPVYNLNSYSLDMMRRIVNPPNGLNEFLIYNTIETLKGHGRRFLSLNFAPLSNKNEDNNSKIIDTLLNILPKEVKKEMYIDSLSKFNEQFNPFWANRYIAYKETLHLPVAFAALAKFEANIDINPSKLIFKYLKNEQK